MRASDIANERLVATPVVTTRDRPWDGVVINRYEWTSAGSVSAGVLQEDVIGVRLSGIVRLTPTRDGKAHSAMIGPGNIGFHPKGMPSTWTWDGPGSIVLMRVRIVGQLLAELERPPHPAQTYISHALSNALALHLTWRFNRQEAPRAASPRGLGPRRLQRVQDFIAANLQQQIDLQMLADLANVRRFHFARLFRQSTGSSAIAYLEQERMRRAQELIRQGRLPLAQVANLVGYADQSYFTRRFRLMVGATPAAYARACA